ncbi:hypothetical protein CTheo_1169 [Ceratobasidium theobromae]|uniref:BTB domain-containing protein n=1 Tax=Ceratobasidium theobromae TaxID=1582974 RepID=A0A5N5QUQ7_9AGAM|nr:hypothetical protein CTheo_1169 [Ceratobasidium theobromae]
MVLKSGNNDTHTLFELPSGGDLTIQSGCGVDFQVHSVILKLASPIFDSMVVVAATKDVVKLSENAKTISLILRFIYPGKKTPTMTSLDMASDCLHMAQKYDMSGVIKNLDEQIASNALPHRLLSSNPMCVYQLAVQFDLRDTKIAAAQFVSVNQLDVCDPQAIPKLICNHYHPSLIRMVALQGARAKILSNVLFNFGKAPILPTSSTFYYDLSCSTCQKSMDALDPSARTPPSWVLAWVRMVYDHLLVAPLKGADGFFRASVLLAFEGAGGICQGCFKDFLRFDKQRPIFEQWARGVEKVLKGKLEVLELLYAL